MFGISLSEIAVIAMIALVVVGPQKLPGMLRTLGQWVRKLRKLTTEVRAQTGIDDILRQEGIDGVHELRSLLRGEIRAARQLQRSQPAHDPYQDAVEFDTGREYPPEGPDAYHAVPDDLFEEDEPAETANAPVDATTAPKEPDVPASPPPAAESAGPKAHGEVKAPSPSNPAPAGFNPSPARVPRPSTGKTS